MYKLLWLIPLALIAFGIWVVLLLPGPVVAFFGFASLVVVVVGGVIYGVLLLLAAGMGG